MVLKHNIYLDYAAATPLRKEVLKAMLPYFSQVFANPSSLHNPGIEARAAIDRAKTQVQTIIHADKIIFTSSGTESINLTLKGVLKSGDQVITTTIEHKAVLETCAFLESQGVSVTYVGVNREGVVSPDDVESAITTKTKLITIHYANNEIGTIQPIQNIARRVQKRGILIHTDACQAGYLDLNMQQLGVDMMTLNGAKIYGPKGIGILAMRGNVPLMPLIHGGGQETGIRGGTENIPAIVGFAMALELAQRERDEENQRLVKLRNLFVEGVLRDIPETIVNGSTKQRIAPNVNILFKGIEGETLLLYLNQQGIYASSGSACSSHEIGISHVLKEIGLSDEDARGSIRFTLGKAATEKDVHTVVQRLKEIVKSLRRI